MTGSPSWAWQFSLPVLDADQRVLAAIVGTHSQAVAELLIKRYRSQIAGCSEGVLEFLADWCGAPAPYETAWHDAFAQAHLALTTAGSDPGGVAVRLALRLTETGHAGIWHGVIAPTTLRLGNLLVPRVERIDVEGSGVRTIVRARTQDGCAIECIRDEATGVWAGDGVEVLPSVGVHRSIYLLGASAAPVSKGGDDVFEGVEAVESIDTAMIQRFREAFGVLGACASEYLQWVELILRGVLVCRREHWFRVMSGSGDAVPGMIYASYPAGRMDIAEILVHESAHQYFYVLDRVGPVDDGSDPTLYWSPPIRKKRPLSRILMAYHALANVRLFYDAVLAKRFDDGGYVEANRQNITESVAQLDIPLRTNRALTRFGRALYEPLATRIAALAS